MDDVLQKDDTKILICRAVKKDDLWSDVFGSGGDVMPWWINVEFIDCTWDTHGQAKITALDPDDPDEQETLTKVITVQDLADAMSALTEGGFTHCGGHPLDSTDECTGDVILQQAVYGDIVYS